MTMLSEIMTLEGALLGATTALATTVIFLYKRIDRGLERCEKDRQLLWERVSHLENNNCSIVGCRLRIPGSNLPPSNSNQ